VNPIKEVSMKKTTSLLLLAGIGLLSTLFFACGGGGSATSGTGTVALFATDDISNFQQVKTTVTKIQLVHTGDNATCDVLTTPETFDLTDLSSLFELLSTTSCPAQPFNRLHIEFEKTVELTDSTGFTNSACSFTSYKDNNNNPNVLNCIGTACTLDITGGVNVLANETIPVALDFDLKNFDVANITLPSCSVTMKVSPLNASDMAGKKSGGYREGVTGFISALDSTAKTFTVTHGNRSFTTDYSGVVQPDIDSLLQLAQDNHLLVVVIGDTIDLSTNSIVASTIYVKADGTVANPDAVTHTFSLTFTSPGTVPMTIPVDYTGAVEVIGDPVAGSFAEVTLEGFSGTSYLARKVEVVSGG
jgi:hypothetical protein